MKTLKLDAEFVADMKMALLNYKFKLCEPPAHDGRQDVWLAACRRRDRQLACVKCMLERLDNEVPKGTKPSLKTWKAFE